MANKEAKQKNNKQKRHYFKDAKAELKKVIWPSPKQLFTNTVGVIGFTLIIAAIVIVLDVCFDAINKYGITAAQEKIQSTYGSSENETSNETDETENSENETDDSGVEAEADVKVVEDDSKSED